MKVLLFAAARQIAGKPAIEIASTAPLAVGDLRKIIEQQYPDLARLMATSRFAVDQAFVDDGHALRGNEEIALIPPVSGG